MQKLKRKKGLDASDNLFETETSAVEKEMYLKMKEPAPNVSILKFWKINRYLTFFLRLLKLFLQCRVQAHQWKEFSL